MSTSQKSELIQQIIYLSQQANTEAAEFQAKIASGLHIHITDLKALLILAYESPLAAGDLVKKLKITPGAVTGVVSRLERAGLAERVVDSSDRRKVSIQLDKKGAQRAQMIYDKIGKRTVELLGSYSAAELQILVSYFEKSLVLMQQQTPELAKKKD